VYDIYELHLNLETDDKQGYRFHPNADNRVMLKTFEISSAHSEEPEFLLRCGHSQHRGYGNEKD
jgi:hypothetical protein